MLTLSIKKKWFDMILLGEKKEEYRGLKPYWGTRFGDQIIFCEHCDAQKCTCNNKVRFRNGYLKSSPSFVATYSLKIGKGKKEWGAEEDKYYYVLTIQETIREEEIK